LLALIRGYWGVHGFRYTFWMRLAAYLRHRTALRPVYWLAELQRRRYGTKYGIDISNDTPIGAGLYIGHIGGIVVNGDSTIGANCNLSHNVTIGKASRGPRLGCPRIGDNVYIGTGAVIFGSIAIGSRVAIGANPVVSKDVEAGMVVAGVPAKVISSQGSWGYVKYTVCDDMIEEDQQGTRIHANDNTDSAGFVPGAGIDQEAIKQAQPPADSLKRISEAAE